MICSVLVCVRTPYHRHSGTVSTAINIITHAKHKAGTHACTHTHMHTCACVHKHTHTEFSTYIVKLTTDLLACDIVLLCK